MSCLTKAIDLNPQNFQYYLDKYLCLKTNERFDEATIFLKYIIEKFPNSAEAFYEKGKFKVIKSNSLFKN
jgi:tetratricopeptide (TPR) repeat protein